MERIPLRVKFSRPLSGPIILFHLSSLFHLSINIPFLFPALFSPFLPNILWSSYTADLSYKFLILWLLIFYRHNDSISILVLFLNTVFELMPLIKIWIVCFFEKKMNTFPTKLMPFFKRLFFEVVFINVSKRIFLWISWALILLLFFSSSKSLRFFVWFLYK